MNTEVLDSYVDGREKFNLIVAILAKYTGKRNLFSRKSQKTRMTPEGILEQLEAGLKKKEQEIEVTYVRHDLLYYLVVLNFNQPLNVKSL